MKLKEFLFSTVILNELMDGEESLQCGWRTSSETFIGFKTWFVL